MALANLEGITAAWVRWYNINKLMHRLGLRPPAAAEDEYYQQRAEPTRDQAHK